MEAAGELSDLINHELRNMYPERAKAMRITLIEAREVLGSFDTRLREYAAQKLVRQGVLLRKGVVKEVKEHHIELTVRPPENMALLGRCCCFGLFIHGVERNWSEQIYWLSMYVHLEYAEGIQRVIFILDLGCAWCAGRLHHTLWPMHMVDWCWADLLHAIFAVCQDQNGTLGGGRSLASLAATSY